LKIKPPRLNSGDKIGIIAPAGPVSPAELQPAIDFLKNKGFLVSESEYLYNKQGYLAGNDDKRLADLHSMFNDKNIKAIFCARGGYGTLRLLDKIDYDLIRRNPKIIVGYSDITALLFSIYIKTGLITFHGPIIKGLISHGDDNINSLLELITSGAMARFTLSGGQVLREGKTKGALIGGNLSLLSSLIGTQFMPSLSGKILFIEERGEPLYRIDRMLTQLNLSGELDRVGGVIAGNFTECGNIREINRLLLDIISNDCPLYSGFPVGHGLSNRTIPLGIEAQFDDTCVV
jgi:muramoyltetrapeptide carboxypeptidase